MQVQNDPEVGKVIVVERRGRRTSNAVTILLLFLAISTWTIGVLLALIVGVLYEMNNNK